MSALAVRRRLPPDLRGKGGWAPLLLALAWTLVAADVLMDALPGGISYPTGSLAVVLTGPLIAIGAVLRAGPRARPSTRLAAGWTGLVGGALVAAHMTYSAPSLAVVVPVILLSAVACTRWPACSLIGAFFIAAFANTLQAFTPLPGPQLIDLILIGLWGGVVWAYLFRVRERPVWVWPGVALCMVYLALTVAAIPAAESIDIGIRGFRATAWYMLAFLLVAYAGWDRRTYHRIAQGFILIAAAVGAYAGFRWLSGQSAEETAIVLATNGKFEIVDGEVRLFGSFSSGKALAAWTAALIPFCLAFALTFKGRWSVPALAAAGLCAVGLLGSEARGAFVGAVAGVALVLVLYQLSRGVPGLHLGITAAAVFGILAAGVFIFTQTAGDDPAGSNRYAELITAPTEDPSYQARMFKWRTALETVWDHPLGQGLGSAQGGVGRFYTIGTSSIDNSYLKVALEQGFAVMVLFIAAIALLLVGLMRRSVLTLDRHRAGLGIGAAGALAAFAILMFSEISIVGLTALATWMVIGLGVSQFTSAPHQADASA